jgi:hypothetical protein
VVVVRFTGPRAQESAALAASAVEFVPHDELLDAVDRAGPSELVLALLRLLCGAPEEFDAAVFARARRGLESAESEVRKRTLGWIAVRPWAAFVPLAEHAAAHDPDEEVRLQARITLLHLRDAR